jgi:hypothetical protein
VLEGERQEDLPGGHDVARLHRPEEDDARARSDDPALLETCGGGRNGGAGRTLVGPSGGDGPHPLPGRSDGARRDVARAPGVVLVAGADEAVAPEGGEPLEVPFRLLEPERRLPELLAGDPPAAAAHLLEAGTGLGEGGESLGLVEPNEELAWANPVPFLEEDLGHRPGDGGAERSLRTLEDAAAHDQRLEEVRPRDSRHVDGGAANRAQAEEQERRRPEGGAGEKDARSSEREAHLVESGTGSLGRGARAPFFRLQPGVGSRRPREKGAAREPLPLLRSSPEGRPTCRRGRRPTGRASARPGRR